MDMDVDISIGPGRRYVRAAAGGQANLQDALRLLHDFQASAEATMPQRLLLDLLQVTGRLQMSEQFNVGASSAGAFRHFNRVAVVQETRLNNGFGALVAKNRGLNIEVFESEDAALEWLLR